MPAMTLVRAAEKVSDVIDAAAGKVLPANTWPAAPANEAQAEDVGQDPVRVIDENSQDWAGLQHQSRSNNSKRNHFCFQEPKFHFCYELNPNQTGLFLYGPDKVGVA